jgi:hypothetical protein
MANTVIGAYGMSKARDHHLVRNLAAEWGRRTCASTPSRRAGEDRVRARAVGGREAAQASASRPRRCGAWASRATSAASPVFLASDAARSSPVSASSPTGGVVTRTLSTRPCVTPRGGPWISTIRRIASATGARLARGQPAAGPARQGARLRALCRRTTWCAGTRSSPSRAGSRRVAQGVGRHRLERRAALHLRGGAAATPAARR